MTSINKRFFPLLLCLLLVFTGMGGISQPASAVSKEPALESPGMEESSPEEGEFLQGINWMETKDDGVQPNGVEVPILMYHHLVEDKDDPSISKDTLWVGEFRHQMELLQENGFHTVTFDQLIAFGQEGTPLPDNPVCITFDDGYSSFYELAYPILQEFHMKATAFPIGVSVGKDTYKDTGSPIVPHFTWAQAREMVDSGLVSIQSHSYDMHQWADYEADPSHLRPNALRQPWETEGDYALALQWDLTMSCNDILLALGERPVVFAYPGGFSSEESDEILQSLGIQCTVVIQGEKATIIPNDPESLYGLTRFYVKPGITDEEFLLWVK